MGFSVPVSVTREHEELRRELVQASQLGGKVGQAAREVVRVLCPRFAKEEEYVLPLLGLLGPLAAGETPPNMERVLELSDRLMDELPDMPAEHESIVSALRRLMAAAKEEKRFEYLFFAERLMLHAQHEQEILYPAAILAGAYARMALGGRNRAAKLAA